MNAKKTGIDEEKAFRNLGNNVCPISDCRGTLKKQGDALRCSDCSEKVTSVHEWRTKCHQSAECDHTLTAGILTPIERIRTPITQKDLDRFRIWAQSNGLL